MGELQEIRKETSSVDERIIELIGLGSDQLFLLIKDLSLFGRRKGSQSFLARPLAATKDLAS